MDTRATILKCALDLFYAKGYDAVGVQEIVDLAGITKPTLYYYFGSKAGLLQNLLKSHLEELKKNLLYAAKFDGDIRETLYQTAKIYVDAAANHKKFYIFMISLFYSAKENETYRAVRPFMLEQYEIVVNIFRDAESILGNMRGRQKQFALGFFGIITQYLLMHFEKDEKIVIEDEIVKGLVDQFMYGIFT